METFGKIEGATEAKMGFPHIIIMHWFFPNDFFHWWTVATSSRRGLCFEGNSFRNALHFRFSSVCWINRSPKNESPTVAWLLTIKMTIARRWMFGGPKIADDAYQDVQFCSTITAVFLDLPWLLRGFESWWMGHFSGDYLGMMHWFSKSQVECCQQTPLVFQLRVFVFVIRPAP